MSSFLPIAIFPEGGLSSSVTTTVLIGVWVVAFFNLRYGWTLSALVVPGYLVPLLIVKPITASVIVLESLLTYWAAWWISEWFRFRGCWVSFFGRDRFFLILLLSVFVRLLFDGLLLPWVAVWIPAWRIDLHSFGLVAVPLVANYLWKPGMIRGLFHLQVVVSATYLLTRYLLIPYTNFRMSGLFYMYEDAAGSMLSSPKSYILLISTAYVASRVNLRYGWEYSGILIPALLALEWLTPSKIAASIVEAGMILIGGRLLLSTSLVRGTTVEGARKIVLFFTVGYVWRMLLGYYLYAFFPHWQISDVYGFGYLLSTLLAIKAHDRAASVRIAGATLRLCGVGGAIGCAIGFGLTFVPGPPSFVSKAAALPAAKPVLRQLERDLAAQLRIDKVRLYAAAITGRRQQASETEVQSFDTGLRTLLEATSVSDEESLDRGSRWMNAAGMEIELVESRYCLIREQEPVRGRGLYVLDLESHSDLVVAVPRPLSVPDSLELALGLFRQQQSRALLIGYDRPSQIVSPASAQQSSSHNYFVRAAHLVSDGNLLVVSGEDSLKPASDRLWGKRSLPAGLNVNHLRRVLPELSVKWGLPFSSPRWLGEFWEGVAVLTVSPRTQLEAAATAADEQELSGDRGLKHHKVLLSRWMQEQKEQIAIEGSEAYRPPTLAEMLYLDTEVVTPLVQIASRAQSVGEIASDDVHRLRLVSLTAAAMDLEVVLLSDTSTHRDYLALRDSPGSEVRHWGTYVFRLGAALPAVLEISRPLAELRTLEVGTTVFQASDTFGLLLPGAHLRANRDGTADLLQFANKVSLLHLVRQAILRKPEQERLLFLQIRGAQFTFPSKAILSSGTLATSHDELPPLTRQLRESLRVRMGIDATISGTRPEAGGYSVSGLHAHLMRSQPASREVASLWLSEELRQEYRPVSDSTLMEDQFLALGIPIRNAKLSDYLLTLAASGSAGDAVGLPDESTLQRLKAMLLEYVERQDILLLRQLQLTYADWTWLRLNDLQTGQPFLILAPDEGGYQLIVNLAPEPRGTEERWHTVPTRENVSDFLRQRERWIEFGRRP